NFGTSNNAKAIQDYKTILNENEQRAYKDGSFLERFKMLAKITKICPVRLDLLYGLHEDLSGGNVESSSNSDSSYRLSATIMIDRHSTIYCRLRAHAVDKEFGTSRLTRLYGEESFLRVKLVRTPTNLDTACRLAFAWKMLDNINYDLKVNSVAHNVSILLRIMSDLRDSTNQSSEIAGKLES
ncbi:unnamed protein product, partial [Adineta ricciae]